MSERDVQDSLKFMREKLRKERKAQNMSQLTLSAEADLACNTICRIEKGTAEPGIGNLLRLTDALHIPMSELFPQGEGPKAKEIGIIDDAQLQEIISLWQKLRQENGERERQKQAAEKKIKAAQYKQKRYEDEVIRCLDGQSRFSEEMLARLIAEAETEVRQAKEEYAELLRNDTTRATIQQIRSYYDEFLGWANEFDLATIPRKRAILGQLIEKVEVGKGYKVTVHLRMSYAQFLGIEGNGEIQVRKDVCA